MEKILELEDGITRFQCDCLSPEDALDVEVSKDFGITITMIYEPVGFWKRVKEAISVLRGKFCWREFVLRAEDKVELRKLLEDHG